MPYVHWARAGDGLKALAGSTSPFHPACSLQATVLQCVHCMLAMCAWFWCGLQVQFLGAVTKQQPFMIVTEYMCGGSLADLFKGARFPNLWRAVQIALDMARGMAYLHSRAPQAVIHRDLKVRVCVRARGPWLSQASG